MAKRRCKGTTRTGRRCKAPPQRDREYCRAHDPTLTDDERFGSSAWSARAGTLGGRPRSPRVSEELRRRVEEQADKFLAPYFDALEATIGNSNVPDHRMRLLAAERAFDRAYGRPRPVSLHEIGHPDIHPDVVMDVSGPEVRRLAHELLRMRQSGDDKAATEKAHEFLAAREDELAERRRARMVADPELREKGGDLRRAPIDP